MKRMFVLLFAAIFLFGCTGAPPSENWTPTAPDATPIPTQTALPATSPTREPSLLPGQTATPTPATASPWEIGACGVVIDAPGEYYLSKSLSIEKGICIVIHRTSDVVLDCRGNNITGVGETRSAAGNLINKEGIRLNITNRVTVRNCVVANLNGTGIMLGGANFSVISNNTVLRSASGISASWSSHNTITDNTAELNQIAGIFLSDNSHNNTLTDNIANSNNLGFFIALSNNNTLTNNTANFNRGAIGGPYSVGLGYGIYVKASSGNTLSSNTATDNLRDVNCINQADQNIDDGGNVCDSNGCSWLTCARN